MTTIYILVSIIGIVIFSIGGYFFYQVFFPKKIEELARMVELGQTKPAIKGLHELMEKDDRDPYVHYLLAECYMQEGNKSHAIVEYRQVLKLGRYGEEFKEIDIRSKLAALYRDQGSLDEAKKEYLILTKLDERNYENFYQVGVLFFNASYFEKALQYLKKASNLNPKHANSYFHIGQIQYRHNQINDARDAFTKTVNLDPKNYKAHYFLGLIMRHLGELDWAIKEFEVAQKDDEIMLRAILGKGLSLIDKKQFGQAMAELEKGIKLAPKNGEAELNLRYYLAHAAESMRDLQTAINNWLIVYELRPDFKDVKQKLKDYEEFRVDDDLKDFMIASPAQFEDISHKLVEAMGYTVVELKLLDDSSIDMLAAEQAAKFRNVRKNNRIIKIRRTTDVTPESTIEQMHEEMRNNNANLGIFITTGEFSNAAQKYAQSRPIDLMNRAALSKLFNQLRTKKR